MSKIALLFAGQGAQIVGMGKDFVVKLPSGRACFDRADAADIASLETTVKALAA